MADDKIQKVEILSGEARPAGESPDLLKVGQWYWVQGDKDRWFGCIIHLGSNYAEVESPRRGTVRIHFDKFLETCELEPSPDRVIEEKIAHYRDKVGGLLERVKEVTAQLAIAPSPMLGGSETQALAIRGQDQPDMKEYGKALVKAKEETLPDLFEKIKKANGSMAVWMTAKVVPLKAQAAGLQSLIGSINDRIFSVELYAGLTEQVERIRDGEPAGLTEKIRLFQRRCYMDEECLARYETGGMEFKDIRAFDAWLTKDENLNRLLPFSRCLVAFRVRRNRKEREMVNLSDFFQIMNDDAADKTTFLYIRNGDQVFRMNTAIDFDEKLFPDLERAQLRGKLWAREFGGDVGHLITDNEHMGILEDFARRKKEWKAADKAYREALKTPEARARAKEKGKREPDAACVDVPYPGMEPWDHDKYIPYDKSSVYFDDITKKVEGKIHEHNRIALILQGLLDRSSVLHPHPAWQIWTAEGFNMALELIYDDVRVLVAGEKPDFEAYRARLNALLKVGSVTVGQEEAWERDEAGKESSRRDRNWRHHGEHYRPTHFRPYGNPGPGSLAKLVGYGKQIGKCSYAWNRKRQTPPYDAPLRTTFSCSSKKILNVSAYTPGDFRIFFNDPRTRHEYLKWAPLLLEAEEYHAGNRKVEDPPAPPPTPKSTWEGQRRYQRKKRRKYLLGKAVRLVRAITTVGGKRYEVDSLWRVTAGEGGTFSISGIKGDGSYARDGRYVREVSDLDFAVDLSIPDPNAPKIKKEKDVDEKDVDVDEDE